MESVIGQIGALSGRSAGDWQGSPDGVVQLARSIRAAGSSLEVVLLVVGEDPLEQLAVLVGDRDVGAVGRGRRHVRLADAADARRRADALDRLARIRLDEEHVPGRHERDDDVRLRGIDGDHVRPHGRRAGPRQAQRRGFVAEIDPLAFGGRIQRSGLNPSPSSSGPRGP